MTFRRHIAAMLTLLALAASAGATPPVDGVDFGRDIVPLFKERCFRCHEGRDAEAGRRLDLKSSVLGEGDGPPLVVPHRSRESRLLATVDGSDPDLRMPPEGPALTADEVARLRTWIDAGARWDRHLLPETDDPEQHWAFRPVERPAVPELSDDRWSANPIDRFLAARQAELGLERAAEAKPEVIVRRLYVNLIGLPPTREEVEAFLADPSPGAVERLVDRLLASPHYGERWARHWLDVARWAESEGFESNHPRAFAWRYRDYVVDSFNSDKPYDRFLREQLAGDELPDYADEHLIATGFLAAARISSNEEDKWLQRSDVTTDIANAVGSAVLGLTWHCAQCHDHKFDPISTRDYYSLHAFFARGMPLNVGLRDPQRVREHKAKRNAEFEAALALKEALFATATRHMQAAVEKQLSDAERQVMAMPADERSVEQEMLARRLSLRFQKTPGEIEKFLPESDRKLNDEVKKKIAALEKSTPPLPQAFAYYAPASSPHEVEILPSLGFYPLPYDREELSRLPTYVMRRGDVHQIGERVVAAWPEWLERRETSAIRSSPATRRELADWLTDRRHPLTARVWVNRLWQHHFGRGLVATPDDFGVRGSPPSHPELLDYLAAELMDDGWSTRHIQRLIATSAAYRLASSGGSTSGDPENRYLVRWGTRRLEAESLRDAMLAASSELQTHQGGASVPLADRETSRRRSLYLFQQRGQPPEMQRLFDGPNECAASVAERHVSTSPLQTLYLLNGPFVLSRAKSLALAIEAEQAGREEQIRSAFRRVLVRDPTHDELAAAERLWQSVATDEPDAATPLVLLCQSLLSLNEFAYLE
jgi:hypothetical protein